MAWTVQDQQEEEKQMCGAGSGYLTKVLSPATPHDVKWDVH